MKPFDLEKALAGAPVVTRDGRPVYDIFLGKHMESKGETYPVMGLIDDESIVDYWTKDGTHNVELLNHSKNDLFMGTEIMFTALITFNGQDRLSGGNNLYRTAKEVEDAFVGNDQFIRAVEVHL